MRKFIVIFSLCLLAFILGAAAWRLVSSPKNNKAVSQDKASGDFHYAYFMQQDFYPEPVPVETLEPKTAQVFGGIVSHHFFAAEQINKLFGSWQGQHFSTIVILGPNHFNAGSAEVQISRYPYQTPFGILAPNLKIIDALINKKIAINEEQPFGREHSISVEVGFIKRLFPDANIVPIIIKHNTTKEKMQQLAQNLNDLLPKDALVLASVDFSHHVTNSVAQKQDKESIEYLKSFNGDSLWKLPSQQIDSPATLYALQKYLELKQAKNFVYWNTNQALLSGSLDSADVTSYVFGQFTKNQFEK